MTRVLARGAALSLLVLACTSKAGPPAPPPPPAELSEVDHLRLENSLLREAQVCQPLQQAKETLVRELERIYHFSVAAGDSLDKDLRKIVRKPPDKGK